MTLGGTRAWGDAKPGSATVSYEYLTRSQLDGAERDVRFATGWVVNQPPYRWPPNVQSRWGWVPLDGPNGRVTWTLLPLYMLDEDGNAVPWDDPSGVTEVHETRVPDDAAGDLTIADFMGLDPEEGSRPESGSGLLPSRDEHSLYVHVRQELTETLEFTGSVSTTWGDTYARQSNHKQSFTIEPFRYRWGLPHGSPHTPFTGVVQLFAELDYLPDVERYTEKERLNGHLALTGEVGDNWEWELSVSGATSNNHGLYLNQLDGNVAACVRSPYFSHCQAEDVDPRLTQLNPFVLPYFGLSSEEEVVELFIRPSRRTSNESRDTQYDITVRGALFRAPGGDARSLFNVTRRSEESELFDETGSVFSRRLGVYSSRWDVGSTGYSNEMGRDTDSVSFELNVPLFGADNARPLLRGLDITFSGRYDDVTSRGGRIVEFEYDCCPAEYDITSLVRVTPRDYLTTWSAGFVWQPNDWLRVRGNVNESYAAPPLASYVNMTRRGFGTYTFRDENYDYILDEEGNRISVDYISITGGNPWLRSERNTTHSMGFDLMPEAVPNLVAGVNFHWNELVDRIGALDLPTRDWTPETLTPDHEFLDVDEATGRLLWPGHYRRVNLGRVLVNGVDLDLTYFVESPIGMFDMRLHYSYLDESLWKLYDDCGPEVADSEGNLRKANCEYDVFDDPTDTVGNLPLWELNPSTDYFDTAPYSVVPRHRASLRLGWERRGLRIGVTTSYQSRTVKGLRRWDQTNSEYLRGTTTTTAATPVNLFVRYDFDKAGRGPDFLRNTRIQFSVPNLFNDNAKYESTPRVDGDTRGYFDPRASRPRGRAFTLTIDKMFNRN